VRLCCLLHEQDGGLTATQQENDIAQF